MRLCTLSTWQIGLGTSGSIFSDSLGDGCEQPRERGKREVSPQNPELASFYLFVFNCCLDVYAEKKRN